MLLAPVNAHSLRPAKSRRWPGWPAIGAGVLAIGCSPALDWREARVEGPGLLALFPCRPVVQTRQIELNQRQVPMRLQACEAGGRTFAVAVADVGDPAAVGPALVLLRQASEGKAASAVAHGWPEPVGATPQATAGRWRLAVPRPEGAPLGLDTALFARGTWVVQASVIGPTADEGANMPFFDGLRFAP